MTRTSQGDVLIQYAPGTDFHLLDAVTKEVIATANDLKSAVDLAARYGGAVWRQNLDVGGRPLGSPVLLLPPSFDGRRAAPETPPREARVASSCCRLGWVCSAHPDEPWPHGDCPVGSACQAPDCPYASTTPGPRMSADR